jgi:hypothetical protein
MGILVGNAVGIELGRLDVGARVGPTVEIKVGCLVGLAIGILVIRVVGVLVGIFVLLGIFLLLLTCLEVGLLVTYVASSVLAIGLFLTGLEVGLLVTAVESSVLATGLLLLIGLEVGLLIIAVMSSVLAIGLRLKVGPLVESSVLKTGSILTGCFFINGLGFGLGVGITAEEPSSVLELFGESSVLELDPGLEDFDLLLPLFPLEPLKFVGCFASEPGLQFPVLPPTFFFNQSRPLFTALSATCLVTLFTLFASVSKIFEHGLLGGLVFVVFVLVGLVFVVFVLVGLVFVLERRTFEEFFFVICGLAICFLLTMLAGLFFTLFVIPPPSFGLILSLTAPSFAPFFFPLQKLLNPFFKH